MEYPSPNHGSPNESPFGFVFDSEEVDAILGRLRDRVEIVDEVAAPVVAVQAPYGYAGLQSAIKRDRNWYR
jgi:hypothetical protein